jgi:hypothetical protein
LYSTFAGGWPGAGLLLMRLVAGSVLLVRASIVLTSDPPPLQATVTAVLLAGSAILLIPGLWTPVVGTFTALLEVWQFVEFTKDPWVPLLIGTICAALAMLGPGLWSVDARLFGWKRVEAPPRKVNSNSH